MLRQCQRTAEEPHKTETTGRNVADELHKGKHKGISREKQPQPQPR